MGWAYDDLASRCFDPPHGRALFWRAVQTCKWDGWGQMGRTIVLVIALSGLWLLLSGYFDKPLLLGFGVVSVAFSTWMAARAGVLDDEGVPGSIMPRVFGYWFWLMLEIGKSNIAVARQVLAIEPRLSPKIIKIVTPTRTNAGYATFANSITLTPGTVTMDLEPGYMLIHALTEELADEAAIMDMGNRVARLEARVAPEELKPPHKGDL